MFTNTGIVVSLPLADCKIPSSTTVFPEDEGAVIVAFPDVEDKKTR